MEKRLDGPPTVNILRDSLADVVRAIYDIPLEEFLAGAKRCYPDFGGTFYAPFKPESNAERKESIRRFKALISECPSK